MSNPAMADGGKEADQTSTSLRKETTLTEKGRQYQIDLKSKRYSKCLKDLRKTGVDIVSKLEDPKYEEKDGTLTQTYINWKGMYVEFIQTEGELLGLLSDSARQQHVATHEVVLAEVNQMKGKMEAKLEPTHHPPDNAPSVSLRSSRSSVRSKISLLRLEETQMRAELEAKAAAVKKKLEIERQQQELDRKMKELEVETELNILDAKKEALLKFEETQNTEPVTLKFEETQNNEPVTKKEEHPQKNPDTSPGADIPQGFPSMLSSLANVLAEQKQLHLPHIELEIFSGSIEKFPIWMKAFETYVEHRVECPVERLHFLSRYTEGDAHNAIVGFLHLRTSEAYLKAKEKLMSRYGNDYLVANNYIRRLREWPMIRSGDNKGLQKIADFLEHCHMASTAITGMQALDDPHIIQLVLRKLPSYIVNKWKRLVDASVHGPSPRYPSFAEFVELMTTEARIACGPVSVQLRDESPQGRGQKNTRGRAHAFASSTEKTACTSCGHRSEEGKAHQKGGGTERSRRPCAICGNDHAEIACKTLSDMGLEDRKAEVDKKRLCRGCLKPGHMWRFCRKKAKCNKCSKMHPTLLHDESLVEKGAAVRQPGQSQKNQPVSGETQVKVSSLRSTAHDSEKHGASHCHTMIVPVKVYRRNRPEHQVITYALLDSQSDASFVTDTLCETLQPETSEVELELSTMSGNETLKCRSASGLVIESIEDGSTVDLPVLYSRQEIPADRDMIPQRDTCLQWSHLHQVADSMPEYHTEAGVGLLLGINCPRAIKPREVIPGKEDDPWAVRTLLGWGIVGLISKEAPKTCFYVSTGQERKKLCHFAYRTRAKEASLRQLQEVFDSGFFDNNREKPVSQEDIVFTRIMAENMHQVEDNHFEAPLPLKSENPMPNNRSLAKARLSGLKTKLQRDEKLRGDYKTFMKELLTRGYAEPVPEEERNGQSGKINYVPHHGIYHQKKGKLRIVFDCSALYNDDCLNSHLLQGPDVNNHLIGILTRFREGPVAFSGDIEGMFNQVRVKPEHRDLLRFLWWSDGDIDSEPSEYRMCTHLFGATSSPAVALFALKKTAETYGGDFSPEAASFVQRDFYIDDGVTSTRSPEAARQLIQDSVSLCSKGGFRLHKFVSNDASVLKTLPLYSLSQNTQTALNEGLPLPCERVLGINWETDSDSLYIDVSLPKKPATRRGILSSVSTIYDPLGFISPCTLVAKNLLKRLCVEKYGWDDTIPEEAQREWQLWKENVEPLSTMRIPRCYLTRQFGEPERYEMHHFSDASYEGCGQCSYLRTIYKDGRSTSTLIIAKSKVTPVRIVTIPRLELVAALMSVKVSSFLRDELSIGSYDEYFWSDSSAVLGYIRNEAKRYHVFVANRVQEIRQHTDPHQWRYIESNSNPADMASRGVGAQDLMRSSLWWHGPPLLIAQTEIPDSNMEFSVSTEDPEVKLSSFRTTTARPETREEEVEAPSVTLSTKLSKQPEGVQPSMADENCSGSEPTKDYPSLAKRMSYFSNWHRARKAVALCQRYKTILTTKPRPSQHASGAPTYVPDRRLKVGDLQQAEQEILKSVQQEAFEEEYAILKSLEKGEDEEMGEKTKVNRKDERRRKTVKRQSALYKLDPFLRDDGLICVGGRMKYSTLSSEVAHPVILPRKSHVTELIVKECHEGASHAGRGSTLNELRAKGYWIIGGRSAVRNYILGCVTCKRLRGKPQMQKMADLPIERTEPAEPFSHCAVDCFGPFYIKERRSELKRWGILFSCLASRSIHLESVNSLSADSFLNAFRRFVSRRGPVRKLFCDNGTNFVGGKNMLEEALKEEDHVQIRRELLKKDCDWFEFRFNVPMASSMGGVWERMIRSVRSALTPLIMTHGHTMDDELFRTLLTECEAIVNSRPISYFSGASDDTLLPLSPNQILTLKSRVAVPYPGSFSSSDLYVRQRWRRVQFLADQFWRRWRREFLPTLQERQKWLHTQPNLQPGDVVTVIDDGEPRSRWPLGRIVSVSPSADGLVRKVCIRIGSAEYDRPVNRVILIMRSRENSQSGSHGA